MIVRGIRGATTVAHNDEQEILGATEELLQKMSSDNNLDTELIAAVVFSVTEDLNAAFPAAAARQLGWNTVPLFCTTEIPVPSGLPLCIRILILYNTDKNQKDIKHAYLNNAKKLRPDLNKQLFGFPS